MFPKIDGPFVFPPSNENSNYSLYSSTLATISLCNFSHSSGGIVVSYCSLKFEFPLTKMLSVILLLIDYFCLSY